MQNRFRARLVAVLLGLVISLTGCADLTSGLAGVGRPSATPLTLVDADIAQVVSSATAAPPSPAASPTSAATATTAATFTPLPTATFSPTATATPLPSATATPSPSATIIPATPTLIPTPPTVSPTPWPTPDGPLTWDERALLFDELWKLVNERYIDPNFNGVNWAAQWDARRARALETPTDAAFYGELREMVWTLNDGHSRFMDPHEAFDHFAASRNTLTYGGLGLYTFDTPDGALVLQVDPGSPAERAGILSCDRILSLNGGRYNGDGGEVGSTAALTIQRPGAGTFNLTLAREEVTQVLDVPGEVLPGRSERIGYVRIDTLWVLDTPDRLRARLARLEEEGPLDGLIIDLRPNLGGWRPVLQGILGTFTQGQLGEFYGRLQSDPLVAPRRDDPPPSHPNLPLVVLVSEHTESYAEVLAATLRAERGAVIIGEPTRGNVETIFPRRLPFGARVWIAEQGFRLNSGATLEGVGVQPDMVDHTDWTPYACGRDPQVDMAAILLEND